MKGKSWWYDLPPDSRGNVETVFNYGKLVKVACISLGIFFAILILNPVSCIGITERGVKTRFGAVVNDNILMPGIILRLPLVEGVVTRSITPHETTISIKLNQNAAVSADTQEIGVIARVFWRYDESRIPVVIKYYQKQDIDVILQATVIEELKAVIGQYTVFDLGANTSTISQKTFAQFSDKIKLPIDIIDFVIADFDWSAEVDKIVEQKITAMASVDKAKAEADRAEQEQRRVSIEAEAHARAEIAKAEGEKQAAILRAEARQAEGQGIANYNRLVAANIEQEIRLRQLEIQLERAKRWDGREIPTYIPLTPAGGVVTLPSTTAR